MKHYPFNFVAVTILFLMVTPSQGNNQASWQLKRLLQPSPKHLHAEQRGQIFIYDGLFEQDVESALTDHFNRIEHMMFIRTKEIQQGMVVQNDDCD